MKQLATILLAIICQGAFAQLVQNPNIDLYIKQTLPQYQQAAGKTQAETMRLLGLRDENYVGGIYVDMDSANFIYDDNDGMHHLKFYIGTEPFMNTGRDIPIVMMKIGM